jgi:hypothetical protein
MAGVVLRLVLRGRFGEEKGAPVGDAADHATRREDLLASCAGDSGIECQLGCCGGGLGRNVRGRRTL